MVYIIHLFGVSVPAGNSSFVEDFVSNADAFVADTDVVPVTVGPADQLLDLAMDLVTERAARLFDVLRHGPTIGERSASRKCDSSAGLHNSSFRRLVY